ncbi:MAG: PhoU domain-containing protein [Planctomycetota bacterium]|jgi:phosphate uptake regulator
MFRELLAAWRKTDPLKEMYESLISMLEAGEWMFGEAWKDAAAGKVRPEVKEEMYRRDIEVNRAERSIRKRIVEHLSIQPGVDIPACLILMSVVKDAERIGDYCKNILDAAKVEAEPLTKCEFFATFQDIEKEIAGMFGKTREALTKSDATLGNEVIVEERSIGARCEALIERLSSETLSARVAVPWALLARYLKRVSAHLGNLASSLVMPLHKLDYFDEKWVKGQPPKNNDG